tara:strand:- start:2436 stop:2783 length:348 start_codon:yes stop_codon:yes gene_type:complete
MKLNYKLNSEAFVFCSVQKSLFKESDILLFFREIEGNTYVVSEKIALSKKIYFKETWALISVETTTALNDVGITNHISSILVKHKIPCNMIAAFHHDHLFIPYNLASDALRILCK